MFHGTRAVHQRHQFGGISDRYEALWEGVVRTQVLIVLFKFTLIDYIMHHTLKVTPFSGA